MRYATKYARRHRHRKVLGTAGRGFLCLIAAQYVGVLVAWLLLFAGFGLIVDGATAMLARAGGAGGLTTHRQ